MKQAPDKPIKDLDIPERVRRLALMRAFHFDLEDLDANHHNYLSEKQRSRLHTAPRREFIVRSILFAILFNIGYLVLGLPYGPPNMWVILIICLGSLLGGFFVSRITYTPDLLEAELLKGDITFVQGKFSWVLKYEIPTSLFREPSPVYAPKIGKIEFPVLTNTEGFVEGQIYRVYYLPYSKTILSVEWIAPEELEQTP